MVFSLEYLSLWRIPYVSPQTDIFLTWIVRGLVRWKTRRTHGKERKSTARTCAAKRRAKNWRRSYAAVIKTAELRRRAKMDGGVTPPCKNIGTAESLHPNLLRTVKWLLSCSSGRSVLNGRCSQRQEAKNHNFVWWILIGCQTVDFIAIPNNKLFPRILLLLRRKLLSWSMWVLR